MTDFPHRYSVTSVGTPEGDLVLQSHGLPDLVAAKPKEFDGPGDRWSPETLLVGAVAGCFLLTFRSVSKIAKLPWTTLVCDVRGTLDRIERVTSFTRFALQATLSVPHGTDPEIAKALMRRAEHACLISNSLNAACALELVVHVQAAEPAGQKVAVER